MKFTNFEKEIIIPEEKAQEKSFICESEDLNIITKYYKKQKKQILSFTNVQKEEMDVKEK